MPSDLIDWKRKGQSTPVAKFEIEVEYVHDLKELYKRVHTWLEEAGFSDFNGMGNYETLYWQRDLPSGLTEHHIWWRAWKHPDRYEQKHFKYFIKFNYQTIAVSKAEVMHKGKKWKMFQSDTILRFEAHLLWDFDTAQGGIFSFLGSRFRQWIYKDKMKMHEDALAGMLVDLQNTIKAFLQLKQDQEVAPNIYPPNALPE